MKSLFTITTEQQGLFSLFYLLAFLIGILILIFEGRRRKYPMSSWVFIIASGVIFFIVGNKLFTYSFWQLEQLFTEHSLLNNGGKTVLGGIVGGIFGFVLAKKILNFKAPVLDTVAIMLPIVMAVQRVGCLMAGCCYGKPTHLPWGIQYGAGTSPFHNHVNSGLISHHETVSLAVHPTQLYQIIFCLLIAFIVWRSRKIWKSSGSLFLLSIALYAIFRFGSEFLRDPHANLWAGEIIIGLKIVQWGLLAAILVIIGLLFSKEKSAKTKHHFKVEVNLTKKLFLLVLLLGILFFCGNWFQLIEKAVIYLILIPTMLGACWEVYKKVSLPGLRWMPVSVVVLGIIMMSQTFTENDQPENEKSTSRIGIIKLGGIAGNYSTTVQNYDIGGYSCSDGYSYVRLSSDEFEHEYYGFGLEYSEKISKDKYKSFKYSIGSYVNYEDTYTREGDITSEQNLVGFKVKMEHNWKDASIGYGVQLGELKFLDLQNNNEEDLTTGNLKEIIIFPSINVRFGDIEKFYFEGHLANHFPSSSPIPFYKLGFGSGLGRTDKNKIGIGFANKSGYISGTIALHRNFLIEVFYLDNFKSGFDQRRCGSLGIQYRFGDITKY